MKFSGYLLEKGRLYGLKDYPECMKHMFSEDCELVVSQNIPLIYNHDHESVDACLGHLINYRWEGNKLWCEFEVTSQILINQIALGEDTFYIGGYYGHIIFKADSFKADSVCNVIKKCTLLEISVLPEPYCEDNFITKEE